MEVGKRIQIMVGVTTAVASLLLAADRSAAQTGDLEKAKYRSMFDQDLLERGLVDTRLVDDRTTRNSTRFLVIGICKGSKPADRENMAVFDNYFKRYYFPMMTHPDELGNIAGMRQELMKQYFGSIKNEAALQPVRDHLNDITLAYMRGLAGINLGVFHPAVRYNAMLIIGDLDSRGPESIGDPRPSEPLLEALEVMRAEFASEDQIDAVRVAALIGITRHAELDRHRPEGRRIPDVGLRKLIEDLLALASEKSPPAKRSAAGHVWMRRQAVEALALLASTRPIGPVAGVMDDIVSNPAEPLLLRCAVAEAQGRMRAPLADGVTAEEAALKLIRLGDEALAAELDSLQPYMDELRVSETASSKSSPTGSRTFDGGGFDLIGSSTPAAGETVVKPDKAPQVAATGRRAKQRLMCIGAGLFGVDGGPGIAVGIRDAATRVKVDRVKTLIDETSTALIEEAPLGKKPLLSEVETYLADIQAHQKQFAEIAPPVRKAPPADIGPGLDTPDPLDVPVTDGPSLDGPSLDAPAADTAPATLPSLP